MLSLFEHIFIIIPYSLYSKSSSSLFPFNLHPTVQNPVWENVTGVLVTPSGSGLTQGTLVEVGKVSGLNVSQPFLPISPMFGTGRSALGIHVDPSYNKDPKEDGTSGCIGLTNPADFRSLWSEIDRYQIRDLQVAIDTKASDNPNVARQK